MRNSAKTTENIRFVKNKQNFTKKPFKRVNDEEEIHKITIELEQEVKSKKNFKHS